MRGDIERSVARTYRGLTFASALLMAAGWIWHLIRGDQTNWIINAGIGLLLLTPLLALAHLAWLAHAQDRLAARYSWIALALLTVAVAIGLLLQPKR